MINTQTTKLTSIFGFVLALLLLSSTAGAQGGPTLGDKTGGDSLGYHDPVADFLRSPAFRNLIDDESLPLEKALDKVHSFNHRFPIGPGQTLFVTEYFTARSVLREPARGVIFLTGPEFRGDFWSIPVEGYHGPEMAARRGFFAYTLDYVGVGQSHLPADGSQISFLTQVAPVRAFIDFVRRSRQVDRVDLVGEGYGGEIAAVLAAEPERVRSVVLSTLVYKTFNPAIEAFFSPQFEAFLRSQPDGYWMPNFLDLTLGFSPNQALRDYVFATQPGVYPTGPALQFWDFGLPTIDTAAAEAPALVIAGELDPFPALGDMAALADDWGGGGTLIVIPGSNHVPRIESEEIALEYFAALFDFLG